jgi:hypothetical protein
VVQATQPCSSTASGSMRVLEALSRTGWDSLSSMGISLTPTENRVRRRLGGLINRSDTLGGMVASTLVLYTISQREVVGGIPK